MPFTPFHLGPGLLFSIPFKKYLHAPTFIIANLVLDIEPLIVLISGAQYPLHGFFHTFIMATAVGTAFGFLMLIAEKSMGPLFLRLQLEPETKPGRAQFVMAGIAGTWLHILFDSPLYSDIQPFFPLNLNPFYGIASSTVIYTLSMWLGIAGIIVFLSSFVISMIKSKN